MQQAGKESRSHASCHFFAICTTTSVAGLGLGLLARGVIPYSEQLPRIFAAWSGDGTEEDVRSVFLDRVSVGLYVDAVAVVFTHVPVEPSELFKLGNATGNLLSAKEIVVFGQGFTWYPSCTRDGLKSLSDDLQLLVSVLLWPVYC